MTPREAARARRPLDGADAQALEAALAGVERLLGNLLADLHGDGGHYVRDHGLEQACDHAHVRLAELRERLDRAEAATAKLRERVRSCEGHYRRAMDAIHEAAGIKRDGLAAILAWVEEARAR